MGAQTLAELLRDNIDKVIYIAGAIVLVILISLLIIRSFLSRKKEVVLTKLAERDQLTSLYNRATCETLIREVLIPRSCA